MSLIDRLYRVRDRLLENPVFQRFSAGFPLTRPIAQREARALFDLCAGFVYSQVLAACVRLDLFQILADGPKTLEDLSQRLALPVENAERLLLAAVSLRLISKRSGGRYGLGMLGAAMNGNPAIAAMVEHHSMLYRDLDDPVGLLRGTTTPTHLAQYWSYAGESQPSALAADRVGEYSALMAASQSLIARDVLDAYPFGRHRCLLDIGGGEGAFVSTAADIYPQLRLMLFDLPAVADRARARLDQSGLSSRVAVQGGSFSSDALPAGADVVSLVRVVHDHDDATVMALFAASHRALPPGGALVIAEPMAGVRGAEPIGDAYFGMYLLAMGRGRPRTAETLCEMLRQAGFACASSHRTRRPMLVSIVSGTRA